jgi:hypothetical protein
MRGQRVAIVVASLSAAVVGVVVAAREGEAPGRSFCDNSMCLRLPQGWSGAVDHGGTASRLIAAPFRLPGWVGNNREGAIDIPRGQFVLMLLHFDRGYRFGWARARTISVSRGRLRLEPTWSPGAWSVSTRAVTFLGLAVNVAVYFADSGPTTNQFDRANAVLATADLAPPPKKPQ